jgi:hypothetical protein
MAMTQGSVSVNGAGIASGAGYAKLLYDALWAITAARMASTASADSTTQAKQMIAEQANVLAGVIGYIQTNGQVASGIPVSTSGTSAAQTGATTAPGTIT